MNKNPQQETALSLYDYWRILRKRHKTILFTFALVFSSAYIFTMRQPPVYQSESTLRINFGQAGAGIGPAMYPETYGDLMESEVARVTSDPVLKLAANTLGYESGNLPGGVQATKTGFTNMLRIKATANDPNTAAKIVEAVTNAYITNRAVESQKQQSRTREYIGQQLESSKQRLRTTEEGLRRFKTEGKSSELLDRYQKRMSELRYQLDNLLKTYTPKHPEVERVKNEIASLKEQLHDLPSEELEYNRLSRELRVTEELYILLNRRFKEAELNEADYSETATIINPPTVPSKPIKPNKPLNLMLGAFMGLMLGITFALIMEHLDTSMYTIDEIEALMEKTVMGVIPFHKPVTPHTSEKKLLKWPRFLRFLRNKTKKSSKSTGTLVILERTIAEEIGEFFHTLTANVRQLATEGLPQVIVISSTSPREGKTFVALNCSVAAAQMGLRVLLISGDVRRPTLHNLLGLEPIPGFMEVLTGACQWEEATRSAEDLLMGGPIDAVDLARSPGLSNLHIMPSGAIPSNPTEIFGSLITLNMPKLIASWSSHYDMIIFDSPPLLPLADALLIGKHADGMLLVFRTGFATRGALRRVKAQLENFHLNLLGIVLNGMRTSDVEPTYGYFKYYKYKYNYRPKNPSP